MKQYRHHQPCSANPWPIRPSRRPRDRQ